MKLLNLQKVLEKVCLSRSTVLRLDASGQFPPHTKIQGVNLWVEAEIDAWIKSYTDLRQTFEPPPVETTS